METNFPQVTQNIPLEEQHNAVLAYLGQLALSKPSAADMLADALTLMAHILPADFVWFWELDRAGGQLLLRTKSSWKNGNVDEGSSIPLEPSSLEDFVLRSPYPVVIEEPRTDIRFRASRFIHASGAASGLAVVIGALGAPFGVLEAFSGQQHTYSRNDVHFFHAVANILALFMETKREETTASGMQNGLPKQKLAVQATLLTDESKQDQQEIRQRLVEGRERERLRLAQQLHDNPIQDLYGLMYQMDDLRDLLKDTNDLGILDEFNDTLHRVVNSLRVTCGELHPPSLSPFGLEVAIRDHVERLRTAAPNLQIHLDLMRDQQSLSDSVRLCLFRIYQQAIHNVIQHSEATDAYIRFHGNDRVVILEVQDNGIGFELPERWLDLVRQEHFGLVGISERVESIQGKLEIVSTPGTGTMVRISVPRR